MGSGVSSSRTKAQLHKSKSELLEHRRQRDDRDTEIRDATNTLVQTVGARSQEQRDRESLEKELALLSEPALAAELTKQRASLVQEHDEELVQRLALAKEEERCQLESQGGDDMHLFHLRDSLRVNGQLLQERHEEAVATNAALVNDACSVEVRAKDDLLSVRDSVRVLLQERDVEIKAAAIQGEELAATRRTRASLEEACEAEMCAQISKTEALEDAHRGLENQANSLQQELGKVVYTVGQRDHELKVKDAELKQVRQSLTQIQDETAGVGKKLQDQCQRVQRVEAELRQSRDIGEHVRSIRHMLTESHGALGQLCTLLAQERSRREQCAENLKQQRVRTELLLQLLQHFRNRTQQLSPHVLLAGSDGGA